MLDFTYIALTRLQTDALFTLDRQVADAVKNPGDGCANIEVVS